VCVVCPQPRKKKPFIDKKTAQHFVLVPRSLQDPLQQEAGVPQMVLVPAGGGPDVSDSASYIGSVRTDRRSVAPPRAMDEVDTLVRRVFVQ
jgi:hypothetical protein